MPIKPSDIAMQGIERVRQHGRMPLLHALPLHVGEHAHAYRVAREELSRVYGAKKAADARYQYQHNDAACQAAGDSLREATAALAEAFDLARILETERAQS